MTVLFFILCCVYVIGWFAFSFAFAYNTYNNTGEYDGRQAILNVVLGLIWPLCLLLAVPYAGAWFAMRSSKEYPPT